MYYNEKISVPDEGKGRIIRRQRSTCVQIMYEYDHNYDPIKKFNVPKRAIIGKTDSKTSTTMYPNDNYYKYFGIKNNKTPPLDITYRSCALKIGTYCVIEKIFEESKLQSILSSVILDSCGVDISGLLKDLVAYLIIDENNNDILYSDYAFNHPLFSKNMHIYSDYTINRFYKLLTNKKFLTVMNECDTNFSTSNKQFTEENGLENDIEDISDSTSIQGISFVKYLALIIKDMMTKHLTDSNIEKEAISKNCNLSRVISELEKIELVKQADGAYVFGNPLTHQQSLLLGCFDIDNSDIISIGRNISKKLENTSKINRLILED